MKKSLFYRVKKMPPSAQTMLLFAVEGVFLQYITSINGFGLNLYATNMGATDSQIGIIQMVPNIVACAAIARPENNAKNSALQNVNYCVTDFRRTPVRLQIRSL